MVRVEITHLVTLLYSPIDRFAGIWRIAAGSTPLETGIPMNARNAVHCPSIPNPEGPRCVASTLVCAIPIMVTTIVTNQINNEFLNDFNFYP